MWDFFVSNVLPVLGTLVLGAIGWLLANFYGEALTRFYVTRRAIHESIFFAGNLHKDSPASEKDAALAELRRLAARLDAIRIASPWPAVSILECLGYDLGKASIGVVGFSNTLTDDSGVRAIHRDSIEHGLGFPVTNTPDAMAKIQARVK